MSRIVVAGGGPAGFMAAIAARERAGGAEVVVRDAGVPLATLLRTGGGRCNLTNASFGPRDLPSQYPRGGSFLLSTFVRFGVEETMEWFRSRGIPLVVEDEGRVFPASGRAEDVKDLLLSEARRLGVRVRARAPVTRIERLAAGFIAAPEERCDAVVVATGGDWGDREGSGYRLARALGHSTTQLAPSLRALTTAEGWPASLAGLALRGVRVVARFEGRKVSDETGDLLFTHRGVSGPLAFRVSARCALLPYSPRSPLSILIALVPGGKAPGAGFREREEELLALLTARPRQSIASVLRAHAARPLAAALCGIAGIDAGKPGSQATREERRALARLLDALPLTVTGSEEGSEMVAAGGIRLAEVYPRTMESRIVPGLFFCGEVLDVDGFTGGFNLQAAWSTGRLAGLGAAARIGYD